MSKYVYYFGGGKAEGNASQKELLGGKGANLHEMTRINLPVPAGFTISTEVCTYFYAKKRTYPRELKTEVENALKKIEKEMGMKFGDPHNPLLVSVRSGARASMPGMMDTILNLGLNDITVHGLIARTKNPRFVYDSYRRFVQMYGDVVLDLKPKTKDDIDPFEEIIIAKKKERGVTLDIELTADDLHELVGEFKAAIKERTGHNFPEDPKDQLWGAIGAVFGSWMNERANVYRKLNGIPESWGTAVNIQSMVFGNMGEDSGTGVAFTRDAASGDNVFYGEFLMNAQGEDVVAGIRTPLPIKTMEKDNPKIYKQLLNVRKTLEQHYRDMMDIEFTIQQGKLYMLQCRVGKRTGFAAIKIAVDMVREKLITPNEAIMRIEPEQLNQLLRPIFNPDEKNKFIKEGRLLAKGLNAGPGAATGKVYFNATDAFDAHHRGERVILVRIETSPEDIKGMDASEGIVTARGGMTSHAALVARQMGKVCVAGCEALQIDYKKRVMRVEVNPVYETYEHLAKYVEVDHPDGEKKRVYLRIKEGDYISLDGSTGEVIVGEVHTKPSEVLQVLIHHTLDAAKAPTYKIYDQLMKWADSVRTLGVRTNADQPNQCQNAIAFGAEGIGLCRTEHMFFGGDRIDAVREMILAESLEGRRSALAKILPYQRADFLEIFRVMKDKPCTIRTLDPPLHEFLPHTDIEIHDLSLKIGVSTDHIKRRIEELHEFNPMLGFRGCRLGVLFPEITEMQGRAIFEAAVQAKKEGVHVHPEIMIPLVGHVNELKLQAAEIHRIAGMVEKETKVKIPYLIGTMIEVPRAAITADEIASEAQFFSFGTNDLTQTTFGLSRDDSNKFLPAYVEKDIYDRDPFQALDRGGVGRLMKIAVEYGRKTRPDLKIGICGEHGGEPSSVEFCHQIGLNYVSCSPFRVPIARLAAARIALTEPKGKSQKPASAKKKKSAKK
jgi:pyruvate,orthophosphate dikinase